MYHKTIAVGNVGNDPELRYTGSGTAVCSFSVAVNDTWKDSSGERHTKTTWYRVSAWRGLAETCNTYVKKGMRVLVEGNVEVHAFQGNDGEPRASLELTARTVQFLSRVEGNGAAPEEDDLPF